MYLRKPFILLLVIALMAGITVAQAHDFDELLGSFAQRRSGVCVIYAHAMALAETDPKAFEDFVKPTPSAWRVKLNGNKWAYVTREEIEKSLKEGFSCGEPDNILTIFCMGVSMKSGGYNYKTGELRYGPDWGKLVGTGNWTLYDNHQAEGFRLKEGMERLEKITGPDGRPTVPCTMGFGTLDKNTCPDYINQITQIKLIGGHDYSVSRYDAEKKIVYLRNPHRPKDLIEASVDMLLNIPAGIDFMESADVETIGKGCCDAEPAK